VFSTSPTWKSFHVGDIEERIPEDVLRKKIPIEL